MFSRRVAPEHNSLFKKQGLTQENSSVHVRSATKKFSAKPNLQVQNYHFRRRATSSEITFSATKHFPFALHFLIFDGQEGECHSPRQLIPDHLLIYEQQRHLQKTTCSPSPEKR